MSESYDITQHFEKAAANYEKDTGISMRNFAQKAISLTPPITSPAVVLDNASGPGTVTGEILKNVSRGER
jgi:hypothetical protein